MSYGKPTIEDKEEAERLFPSVIKKEGLFRKVCKTAYRRMLRDKNIRENVEWIKGYNVTLKQFKHDFEFIPDKIEKGVSYLNYRIYIEGLEFLHSPYINNADDKYEIFCRIGSEIISHDHRSKLGALLTRGDIY